MAWQRAFVLMSCLAAAAAGCRPQLPPDPDAVLYYFRDARVQGEVKRVWPEGQKYVDNVLAADAKLQKELGKLTPWQTPESLWPREDPRWQDGDAVKKQIDVLTKLLGTDQTDRNESLDKLRAAVGAVPATVTLPPAGSAADFAEKAWQALALDGSALGLDVREAPAKFTEFAQAHLNLFQAVQTAAGDLDPQTPGLHFKDTARQQQIEQRYADLAKRLEQQRGTFLQYAERELLASRPSGAKAAQERYLGFRRAYLRKQLEALPKAIAGVEERTQTEFERAERGKIKASSAQVAFWKQRVKNLAAEREELKSRVEAILKKAQAGT